MVNGILKFDENNKQIIFDCNKCIDPSTLQQYFTVTFNIDSELKKEILYRNGFKVNALEVILKNLSTYSVLTFVMHSDTSAFNNIISFSIDSFDGIDDDICISVKISSYLLSLYFIGKSLSLFKTYDMAASPISSNMLSFMLTRTNPKLTGNIKLVVTEDYKLYLDSFKVSTTSVLNKQEYRHQPISDEGNYPYDVYRVFNSLPNGEMYRVYDDSYDPHKKYYDPYLQIENIYEYGALNNTDHLYTENMKILAPLYIGKEIPSFFAIFATNRLVTTESPVDNALIFKDMIKDSDCVKIFDLRKSTTIGKYLNNYKDMVTQYLSGTCALQFIEQDNVKGSANYRQGKNSWKGIVYDKGIFADKTETSYFASNILNNVLQRLEKYNKFLIDGYSRNKLLYPNIINLEFMFNDDKAEDLIMHNYFGLYLTENDFLTFNLVIKSYDKFGNLKLEYYDKDSNIIPDIYLTSLLHVNNANYKDRIFFATTLNDAIRLKSTTLINNFVLSSVANKPYENVALIKGNKISFGQDEKSFISFNFTKLIHYGEHFKFIINDNNKNVILDIIASNDEQLTLTFLNISQYVLSNNDERYIDKLDSGNLIYRICFYSLDLEDSSVPAKLSDLIYRITNCIKKLSDYIKVGSCNKESLSVISKYRDTTFLHIMYDDVDNVRYFNKQNEYEPFILNNKPDEYALNDMKYSNPFFETYGPSYSTIVQLQDVMAFGNDSIYDIQEDLHKQLEKIFCPLIYTYKGYYPMTLFDVTNYIISYGDDLQSTNKTLNVNEFNSVISPFNVDRNIVISVFDIPLNNDLINISSPMKSHIALMGINGIKDIDMYVNVNECYQFLTEYSISFSKGESVDINNNNKIKKYTTYTLVSGSIDILPINVGNKFLITKDKIYYTNGTNSVCEYVIQTNVMTFTNVSVIELSYTDQFDKYSYQTLLPMMIEDNMYVDPLDTLNSVLESPLVPLVNCEWKSNGTYFDNNSLMNTDTFNNYVLEGNFIENCYTPSDSAMYVSSKLSDVVEIDGEKMTIKDIILSGKYNNAIKKYLIRDSKIDTAIAYYNSYVLSLEFIYYGIKFIFKLTNAKYINEIKLNQYNNYEIFVMNDYNASSVNELFISTTEEFILLINHTYMINDSFNNSDIKMLTNDIAELDYNWYDAPYNYELINTYATNSKLYLLKSNNKLIEDKDNVAYLVEEDYKKYEGFDEDNAFFVINMLDCSSNYSYDEFPSIANNKFDFFINDVANPNETYFGNTNYIYDRYKSSTIDYRDKHALMVKYNNNIKTKTYEDKINGYIESFGTDLTTYIITEEGSQIFNINDSYTPMTISLSTPNMIKFNQGLFDPNFVDVFKFNISDDISDILGIDTLYANTEIKSIESILNVYYNKILDANKTCDYNYFCKQHLSPIATDWDSDIYRLYDDDSTFKYVDGYSLGITDKMLFGSKCIAIHRQCVYLNKWNYKGNSNNALFVKTPFMKNGKAVNNLLITLNLTDTFSNILMEDDNFVKNWNKIGNVSKMSVYINNYINKTLTLMFDLNNPVVTLFSKYDKSLNNKQANEYFDKFEPIDFNQSYKEYSNISSSLSKTNGKLILTMTIQDYENNHFYPIIKIIKV